MKKPLENIQAVLFDLDGLLVDSDPVSLAAVNSLLEPFESQINAADYRPLIGSDYDTFTQALIDRFGLPYSQQAVKEKHFSALLESLPANLRMMPGVNRLLNRLEPTGLPLAVASNALIEYVHASLEVAGIARYFKCVFGGDEIRNPKPAPDVYLAAARCLGHSPEHCLVVEDSPIGLQAARAAGMACVVIPNVELTKAEFDGAVAYFDSLADLADHLDEVIRLPA